MHFCNTVHLLMGYRIFVILMLCRFLEKKGVFLHVFKLLPMFSEQHCTPQAIVNIN